MKILQFPLVKIIAFFATNVFRCLLSLFQLSVIALVLKVFFLLSLQELSAVALQRQEKITFKTAGLLLQFGAVCMSFFRMFCFKFIFLVKKRLVCRFKFYSEIIFVLKIYPLLPAFVTTNHHSPVLSNTSISEPVFTFSNITEAAFFS